MSTDPMHYFNQLDSESPDETSIFAYLHALHAQANAQGVDCIAPEHFYSEAALDLWHVAWSERNQNVQFPIHVDLLQIRSILFNALTPFHCNTTGMDCITMVDRIRRAQQIQTMWLSEQPVENENDDKKKVQRGVDRVKDSQHRMRLRARDDGSPEVLHAKALKAAYDAYMLACRQRKEAETQWGQYIAAKKAEWDALKVKK